MNTFKIIIFLSILSFQAFAVDIPSREGLSGRAKKHFKKQEKVLKNRGYRFGDDELATKIRSKIITREICEDYDVDTGVKAGLFGLNIRIGNSLGLSEKSVFNFDHILANNIDALKNLPPVCKKNFLASYKNHKGENAQVEDDYCEYRDCELVEEAYNLYIDNIAAIEESIDEKDLIVINKIECDNLSVSSDDAVEEIATLADMIKDVKDCTPLNVGESRVTSQFDRLNNYVEQKYAITNLGDDKYRVDLNINFVPGNYIGSSHEKATLMMDKMKACIREFNEVAKDSLGRQLQFNVMTPTETQSLPEELRPPQVDIAVRAPDSGRQNSRAYNEDITCDVLSHEMLHLLGLHDEYPEKHIGTYTHKVTGEVIKYYKEDGSFNKEGMATVDANKDDYHAELAYQCRAVPEKNTIMKDLFTFYSKAVTSDSVCSCAGLSDSRLKMCQDIFKKDKAARDHYFQMSTSRFEELENMKKYCDFGDMLETISLDSFSDIKNHNLIGDVNRTDLSIEFTKFQASYGDFGKVSLYPSRRSCQCDVGDGECLGVIEAISKMSSDSNSIETRECPFPSKKTDMHGEEITDPLNYAVFPRGGKAISPPMLENAHVEKILFPGCDSRGSKYVDCLGGAYSPAGASCSGTPSFCSDDSWLSDI